VTGDGGLDRARPHDQLGVGGPQRGGVGGRHRALLAIELGVVPGWVTVEGRSVMGLFGPKIVCDQCNKKVKEATTVYFRGSRFCDAKCVDAWGVANPAPVAKGDPAKLRDELAMLIDEAITESQRAFNPAFGLQVGNVTVSVGGPLGAMDERHRAEQMQRSREQFQTYVMRSTAILRALGFTQAAAAIAGTDFTKTAGYHLVDALRQVRQQL
jgi:hypothetical protein